MIALIAENDRHLGLALAEGLEQHGMTVEIVRFGYEVLRNATDRDYAAIVIASRLPDCNAAGLCQKMRDERVVSPIIVLADPGDSTEDRVAGLENGADDCVTWPLTCRELAARIHAIQRRGPMCDQTVVLACGDLRLDRTSRRAWRGEAGIDLTATESALLEVLMSHPDVVLRHRFLREQTWGSAAETCCSNILPVYVRYLREKIDRPFDRASVQTIRGVGYRLSAED